MELITALYSTEIFMHASRVSDFASTEMFMHESHHRDVMYTDMYASHYYVSQAQIPSSEICIRYNQCLK